MNNWYIRYDWRLKERARENRKNSTPAERVIWDKILRKKQFFWYKFLRQKMMNFFIVDFYCSKLKLIIEIDWWYHNEKKEYDTERSIELNRLWVNVIRFTNNEVLHNLSIVHKKLYNYINNIIPPDKGVRGF